MLTNKSEEVRAGLAGQRHLLDEFYRQYVLNGRLAQDFGRQLGDIWFQETGTYDSSDYLIIESGLQIGYVEVKERYIASTQYGDMVCPECKTAFAKRMGLPFYMVQGYLDGIYVLNINQIEPFKVVPLQRKDWRERGDRELIPHSFYDLKLAVKL